MPFAAPRCPPPPLPIPHETNQCSRSTLSEIWEHLLRLQSLNDHSYPFSRVPPLPPNFSDYKRTKLRFAGTNRGRYDSLKADLSVSLEETRGGADAAAFGAPSKSSGDRPWGGSGAGGPTTIADVIAASTSAGGSFFHGGEEGGAGEGQYLWGCTSSQEEREQLVSFVSLGCFDPSARLQVCVVCSTPCVVVPRWVSGCCAPSLCLRYPGSVFQV